MSGSGDFDAEAYVDAASGALGLTLDPAHRPGVVETMRTLHAMSLLVLDLDLPVDLDPAPVFRP